MSARVVDFLNRPVDLSSVIHFLRRPIHLPRVMRRSTHELDRAAALLRHKGYYILRDAASVNARAQLLAIGRTGIFLVFVPDRGDQLQRDGFRAMRRTTKAAITMAKELGLPKRLTFPVLLVNADELGDIGGKWPVDIVSPSDLLSYVSKCPASIRPEDVLQLAATVWNRRVAG